MKKITKKGVRIMKILLLADRMEMGGAETHIAQLARGLCAMGCEVSILSEGGALADALASEGVGRIYLPLSTKNPLRMLAMRRTLRRLVRDGNYEILHAHTRKTALLLRAVKPSQAARIVTVHARFRTNACLRRLCFWGDRTVAVSEDLRAYVCDAYGVAAERVSVIPNGIDCTRFSPPDPDARRGAPHILFASRLDSDCAMGAWLLCELAPALCRRFPGVKIDVAGGGDAYSEIYAHADAVNRRLGRTVISTPGRVENMPALLRGYDIFVGVSRAAMEAAATGCAVILCGNEGYGGILSAETADRACLSNFCARGGELPDADRLYRDLSRLIESPDLRRRCGDEGRRLMTQAYDADRMCRETLTVYHRARPIKKTLTLTVGGYFGCGNLGDDAILGGMLSGISELAPNVALRALTGGGLGDRRRFGIACVSRKRPASIMRSMLVSRAFLCGGGSLLQSVTSRRSLSYYLALLRLSRVLGCRTVLYAAGVGPLPGKRDRDRVLGVLQACDYVGVRDRDSFSFLSTNGIDAARLRLGADPAVLLPLPPKSRGVFLLASHNAPTDRAYLAIVLHGKAPAPLVDNLLCAARIVCARFGLFAVLPILDRRVDAAPTRAAARRLSGAVIEAREASDVTAILSTCRAAVSLRLHALVLSTCAGVPALGIAADARDPKIAAFAKAAGQDFLDPATCSVPMLVEAISKTLTDRDTRAPILRETAARMRHDAKADLGRILDLCRGRDGNY